MQVNTQTKRKHTGGRPQLSAEERRCLRVQPSFTVAEFDVLEEKAAAAGLEVSEWLRTASLGLLIKSVPAINRLAYSELAKLASNINQIAHAANAANALNTSDLVKTLEETHQKVQQLRAELITGAH